MKKKILIVEDEEMLLRVLSEQFDKAGFDVQTASDGEEALKSLGKSMPDLVLLDIILPKMNGFDVLKAIKENPNTKDTPVIMISNLGQDTDIKQAIKLGAVDYFIKAQHPIFEIIEKVDKFLSTPKSPLEKPREITKDKKTAAPVEAIKEKSIEVEKIPEKPVEKPVEKIVEKPIEEKPVKTIAEKPIEKPINRPVEKVVEKLAVKTEEKPIEKTIEKSIEKVAEKQKVVVEKPVVEKRIEKAVESPKKEAVKKPSEEAGELLSRVIGIAKESAKEVAKKQAEKAAEKQKIVEKPEIKKIEAKPAEIKKPIEKKIKKEDKYPQLPKSARKFIRIKKAELSKMELESDKYEEEVAKLYQTFSPKKKTGSTT